MPVKIYFWHASFFCPYGSIFFRHNHSCNGEILFNNAYDFHYLYNVQPVLPVVLPFRLTHVETPPLSGAFAETNSWRKTEVFGD